MSHSKKLKILKIELHLFCFDYVLIYYFTISVSSKTKSSGIRGSEKGEKSIFKVRSNGKYMSAGHDRIKEDKAFQKENKTIASF